MPERPAHSAEFSLRKATLEDIPEVLEIEKRCYPFPWGVEHFRSELVKPYSQFLVLTDEETDSKIAGFIVFWLMFDQCEILNVAVSLEQRGQGFGRVMVREAVDLALKKNLKRVVLNVRKSNAGAIQLYQNLGFNIVHLRKGFYTNGEDAYEMALDLSGPRIEF